MMMMMTVSHPMLANFVYRVNFEFSGWNEFNVCLFVGGVHECVCMCMRVCGVIFYRV